MSEKNSNTSQKARPVARLSTGGWILLGVGLILAIALFIFLRGFVACWQLTSLPGLPPASCGVAA
ncbi:MAG: hypothetical protein CO064_05275, partial [Anaerolineae bacterium CG_4_9_14_0_8_um_filter_58_9]